MNILQSIAGNKTILKVALGQISNAIAKDGVSAIVIVRDPNKESEESGDLDIKIYKEPIGVLSGADLIEYQEYLNAKRDNFARIEERISENDKRIVNDTAPLNEEKEVDDVHGD